MNTLTYPQFRDRLIEDLKSGFPQADISSIYLSKTRGRSYDGISVCFKDKNAGPVINAEAIYSDYRLTGDFRSSADRACQFVSDSMERMPSLPFAQLNDYDRMRETLVLQLIPIEGNEELLEDVPFRTVHDMALLCRFVMEPSAGQTPSLLVRKDLLDSFGITEDELFDDALEFAPRNRPATLQPLEEVIARMLGEDVPQADSLPAYVASVQGAFMGAAAVLYPGFLQDAAALLGGSFYMIPSSVHEMLLIPCSEEADPKLLHSMLCNVNKYEVEEEDLLSNTLYRYDAEKDAILVAESGDGPLH
ncbi:MAG: hypothetical protein HUJ80_06495 [Firmicutes bacterium]|nr:hypothetical protein [Bacillota bacterium]